MPYNVYCKMLLVILKSISLLFIHTNLFKREKYKKNLTFRLMPLAKLIKEGENINERERKKKINLKKKYLPLY